MVMTQRIGPAMPGSPPQSVWASLCAIPICACCLPVCGHQRHTCVYYRARAELARIFAKIIETRRATGSTEDDMLQVTTA